MSVLKLKILLKSVYIFLAWWNKDNRLWTVSWLRKVNFRMPVFTSGSLLSRTFEVAVWCPSWCWWFHFAVILSSVFHILSLCLNLPYCLSTITSCSWQYTTLYKYPHWYTFLELICWVSRTRTINFPSVSFTRRKFQGNLVWQLVQIPFIINRYKDLFRMNFCLFCVLLYFPDSHVCLLSTLQVVEMVMEYLPASSYGLILWMIQDAFQTILLIIKIVS